MPVEGRVWGADRGTRPPPHSPIAELKSALDAHTKIRREIELSFTPYAETTPAAKENLSYMSYLSCKPHDTGVYPDPKDASRPSRLGRTASTDHEHALVRRPPLYRGTQVKAASEPDRVMSGNAEGRRA